MVSRVLLDRPEKPLGTKDVRIAGGANVIQQYLNAGLVDEFTIHYSPVFFGHGAQLFSGTNKDIHVKIKEAIPSKEVTHVTFKVRDKCDFLLRALLLYRSSSLPQMPTEGV